MICTKAGLAQFTPLAIPIRKSKPKSTAKTILEAGPAPATIASDQRPDFRLYGL